MKTQVVHIEYSLQPLGNFHVDARVVDKDPGIHEISLSLGLAAPETRQETVWLDQAHAGLRQANPVSIPK